MLVIQVVCSYMLLSILLLSQVCPARHVDRDESVKTVFVMGADELVGEATVSALSATYGEIIEIRAGVSHPVKGLKNKPGVTVVHAEFGDRKNLQELFKNVYSLYLTSPRGEDRVELVIATAQAAKDAGVKHILLYSLTAVDDPDTVLGRQYSAIETALSCLHVQLTVFRLSTFMENFLGFVPAIESESVIRWPVDHTKQFTPVAMSDAALAAATVLVSPGKHTGMTYTIVSDRITFGDVVEAFSIRFQLPINYERISYDEAETFLAKHGFSEKYAKAIMELYRLVDTGSSITNQKNMNDFKKITGYKPTTLFQWVAELPI